MSIRIRLVCLQLIITVVPTFVTAQSRQQSKSTVDSLKEELRKSNLLYEHANKEVYRLRYLSAAKEMALRSVELEDSALQALVAMQAYKFNKNYGGNMADIDIYRALYSASERFDDHLIKSFPPGTESGDKDFIGKASAVMAGQLCFRLTRNMTLAEWNKFTGHLPYEGTCEKISIKVSGDR